MTRQEQLDRAGAIVRTTYEAMEGARDLISDARVGIMPSVALDRLDSAMTRALAIRAELSELLHGLREVQVSRGVKP